METKNNQWEDRAKKNTLHLAFWTGAWLATLAVASFGPKLLWDSSITVSLLAVLLNIAVGMGMILANRRYLNGLDEMQRKISLEAMGISLGMAVVVGLGYSMLDLANVVSYDAEISHLVVLIGVTHMAGFILGNLRYK